MTEISKVYAQCKALFSALISDESSRAFFGPMEAMSDAAYAQADSRFLDRMLKELLLLSRTFPQITQEMILDLGLEVLDQRRAVEKIVKKGRIGSAEQFRIVSEFVDEIAQDEQERPLLIELSGLLREFEVRMAKRRRS